MILSKITKFKPTQANITDTGNTKTSRKPHEHGDDLNRPKKSPKLKSTQQGGIILSKSPILTKGTCPCLKFHG